MTLKSASFKCLLLDLTLIWTIVLSIRSLKLSSLLPPDMHALNGTIKRRTGGKLLKLGLTPKMVPVSLVSAPFFSKSKLKSLHYINELFMLFERYTEILTKCFSNLDKDIDEKLSDIQKLNALLKGIKTQDMELSASKAIISQ